MTAALLPSNRSPLEATLANTLGTIGELPVSIADLKNVDAIPARLLPYLAAELSVDIWDDDWPVETQRSVLRSEIELHRRKGTLRGLKRYLDRVGVDVLGVLTPPQFVFSGPSMTREEREAWLADLPQVRIYQTREPGTAAGALWSGGPTWPVFRETTFPLPNDALAQTAKRARYVVDGEETDAAVRQNGTIYTVAVRGTAADCGRYMGLSHFMPNTAPERLFTIRPSLSMPWRHPVIPSIEPITSEPELIAEKGTAGAMSYSGRAMVTGYFVPSTAGDQLYERFALVDPSRPGVGAPPISFMSMNRFGMPPHTAEAKAKIRGSRSPAAAGEGLLIPGTRFWFPNDMTQLERAAHAATVSKRLTDRIYFDTKTEPGFIAGLPFIAGRDEHIV